MPIKAMSNVTVTYNSTDITQYLNTQSLEAVVNEIDVTNLASTADEVIAGSAKWTVNVGGFWAKALDDVLGPDAVSPPASMRNLVVVLGTGSTATYTWTSAAFISNYKVEASDPKSMLGWSGTLAVSAAPVRS